jgi:hypothetical protein
MFAKRKTIEKTKSPSKAERERQRAKTDRSIKSRPARKIVPKAPARRLILPDTTAAVRPMGRMRSVPRRLALPRGARTSVRLRKRAAT